MRNQSKYNKVKSQKPSISIVTSLYRSEGYIVEFYNRVMDEIEILGCEYELIFVQDGPTDNAHLLVKKLIEKDENVTLVELTKNFGHQLAMLAGIQISRLDTVFTIDVDLEEPPESISRFYNHLVANWDNMDTVVGTLERRDIKSIERLSGKLFYSIFNKLSDSLIQPNQLWSRIMKREFVDAFLKYNEYLRFTAGLFSISGFVQVYLPVKKSFKGSSSYSMLDRIAAAVDAITSFSVKPLKILFFIGLTSFISSVFIGSILVFSKIFIDYYSGWLSILTSIIFFGSLNMMAIGLVGVYVSSVYMEVKNRPRYLIKKIW